LATPTFIAMHKVNVEANVFDNNQYPCVWFKTHHLTIANNVLVMT